MDTLPISSVPSQSFSITLNGQYCRISVYQKSTGVFLDLTVGTNAICTSAICLDRVGIIRLAGFNGQLRFVDTQGATDPVYTGFNTRYKLTYLP